MATSGLRRRTAPSELSRSRVSWLRFSAATRTARGSASPGTLSSVHAPVGRSGSATSLALSAKHQKATDRDGRPTFPILHERDERGEPIMVPHGVLPSMHSVRHTVASRALLAGESVDEVHSCWATATPM